MSNASRTFLTFAAVLCLGTASCGVSVQSGGGGHDDPPPDPPPTTTTTTPQELRIVAGGDNTCVISATGRVACWGSGETGQLGLGSFADQRTPAWIPGLTGVVDLAVGDFSMCARTQDGAVSCWGMNFYGQLNAETEDCPGLGYGCSKVPIDTGVTGAGRLTAGAHHYCAVLEPEGDLHCWGSEPITDVSDLRVLSAAAGYAHTCVLFAPEPGADPTHNVVCQGDPSAGQLGFGLPAGSATNIFVNGGTGGFVELAAGASFTCGINAASELSCWGENQYGALGVGVSPDSDFPESCPASGGACARQPVLVTALPSVAHVAAHFQQACAVTTDGDVYCWGTPSRTSPASASACWEPSEECAPTPKLVPGVSHAKSIAVGYGHACVIDASDEIQCWGLDTHGQLGRGWGASYETTPVTVTLPPETM